MCICLTLFPARISYEDIGPMGKRISRENPEFHVISLRPPTIAWHKIRVKCLVFFGSKTFIHQGEFSACISGSACITAFRKTLIMKMQPGAVIRQWSSAVTVKVSQLSEGLFASLRMAQGNGRVRYTAPFSPKIRMEY